jgi:hypothetical protein
MLTIVWINRAEAQLIHFSRDKMERKYLRPNSGGLYSATAQELSGAGCILIAGPGVAKYNLHSVLREHFPATSKKILAIEPLAEPSDAALAALASKHLRLPA